MVKFEEKQLVFHLF